MLMKRLIYNCILPLFAFALSSPAQDENLPSIDVVLEHVSTMANHEQGNDRLFRSRYSFVQVRTMRELDGKGRVRKEDSKQTRNNPSVRPAAFKTTQKRDAGPSSGNQETSDKPFETDEFAINDDLLNRFDFSIVKRETINGRNAIVIDFRPANKKLPTRSLKDRFINKTAGRVWVDEGDWMLAKIDFHLVDSVNVVGGLVGAVKSFNFQLDRQRTPDALWYVTDINWRLVGREFFSRKIMECEDRRSEVRKIR